MEWSDPRTTLEKLDRDIKDNYFYRDLDNFQYDVVTELKKAASSFRLCAYKDAYVFTKRILNLIDNGNLVIGTLETTRLRDKLCEYEDAYCCMLATHQTHFGYDPNEVWSYDDRTDRFVCCISNCVDKYDEKSEDIRKVQINIETLTKSFKEYVEKTLDPDMEAVAMICADSKEFERGGDIVITSLVFPDQVSDENGVQPDLNPEYISIVEEKGLVAIGWIHSHPHQTCYFSSVDMHAHHALQASIPYSFGIVYAREDKTLPIALTQKGMETIGECSDFGFHTHEVNGKTVPNSELVYVPKHLVYIPKNKYKIYSLIQGGHKPMEEK